MGRPLQMERGVMSRTTSSAQEQQDVLQEGDPPHKGSQPSEPRERQTVAQVDQSGRRHKHDAKLIQGGVQRLTDVMENRHLSYEQRVEGGGSADVQNANRNFLLSLLPSMNKMSENQVLLFKETEWGNVTTGPDQVYITSKETSRTPNTTLQTYQSNVTTGPDQVYNTSKETSGTPNTTLETYWSKITTGPDQVYITSEETSGAPNTTLETYWSNVTTRPDQVYNTSEETSGTSSPTIVMDSSHNTTGPDLVYTTNEEISRTLNNTVVSNVTTGSDLVYNTSAETFGTPNSTLETYQSHVTTDLFYITSEKSTTGPGLTYAYGETSRTPNTTLEIYPSNTSSGSHLTYATEDTTRIPNTTVETSPSNVTTGPDQVYITEMSRTPNTTIETPPSNVTTGPDPVYITEMSRTPNTTIETSPSNVTTSPDQVYITEMSRTPNTTLQIPSSITTSPDLGNISEETTGAPDGNSTFYTGAMYCLQDADCPPFTMCTEQGGLHMCQCQMGSYFHPTLGCVTARTFPARIPSSVLYWDETLVKTSQYTNNEDEIRHPESAHHLRGIHRAALLFQNILGHVPGYLSTSITNVQLDEGLVTIVHSFSTLYPVTEEDLWGVLTVSPLLCIGPHSDCVSPLSSDTYQALSLCDFDACDSSSSDCRSHGGLVTCECRRGYYKFSPTDRSCRACASGFQRTQNGCDRCPIGFGGFDCEESYLLVVIVESCVGCILLVSLITLLVFYFRRKEPQKPTFIDSIVLGVPTGQPSVRLPRAQFSWRREWEWNEPQEKVLADIHQQAPTPDGPVIHMKTFGDPARFSSPNTSHGRQNLSFISD